MKIVSFALLMFAVLAPPACNQSKPTGILEGETFTTKSGDAKFRVETVATNLEVPWGFAFLPNGDLMFTERPGRVRLIEGGKLRAEPVFKVPDVEPSSESGLMDVSLHPDFAKNGYVYLAYSYRADGKQVKVVRYRYENAKLTENKIIVENIPGAPNHAGTRARFGPDGKLYVTTGDSTDWSLGQKTDTLAGKTLRLNDDGSIPEDNPFVGDKKYRPEIYSTGHRNAQGLAWTKDGLMLQTEHGPSGFEGKGGGNDEVNIVDRGKNYGWPEIYGDKTKTGMELPLLAYNPSCAPASGAVYTGAKFPAFADNFFFGCLRGARLIRVVLDGRKVVSQENLLEEKVGRVREVATGPDGAIYISTSNRDSRGTPDTKDDRILRLVPVQ